MYVRGTRLNSLQRITTEFCLGSKSNFNGYVYNICTFIVSILFAKLKFDKKLCV